VCGDCVIVWVCTHEGVSDGVMVGLEGMSGDCVIVWVCDCEL